jgi:hypothetical protein
MFILETILLPRLLKNYESAIDNLYHSIIYFSYTNKNILLLYILNYIFQWLIYSKKIIL